MTSQLKEKEAAQAIGVINDLIIPDSEKLKLKTIAKKIYQSIKLTQEEKQHFGIHFPTVKNLIF